MARGRRWIDAEIQLLMEMVKDGMSAKETMKSGSFPDRTHKSIEND